MKPQPITCTLCGALAVRFLVLFQCRRNPRHIADLARRVWFECAKKGN